MERKLAAILYADVAGYSRLTGADEEGTHRALGAALDRLSETVEQHGGRVCHTAGDAILAEFPTVSAAVTCAVAAQGEFASWNADVPEDRQLRFRMGINLGEVIADRGEIYGDGVNVAARLETLAEPGGICVSGAVFDAVDGKLDLGFRDLGAQQVKNIAKPVRAYGVVTDGSAPTEDAPAPAGLPLPEKPSVAVLPFKNISGDAEQEYFADGVTEDIIMALSRVRWFFVIARNSTFVYKGEAVDVKRVAADLGVRYVVEGSVRRGGDRVRVAAQLIDGVSGGTVWVERYDRALADIFELQDDITETIVGAVLPELGRAERERSRSKKPENVDAWDIYQRGMSHLYHYTKDDLAEARTQFAEAMAIDAGLSLAYSGLAEAYYYEVVYGFADDADDNRAKAIDVAQRAVALDAEDAGARCTLGRIHYLRREYPPAIRELETALQLNPSLALAHYGLGAALVFSGRPADAFPHLERAIRLSPHDPNMGSFLVRIADASYFTEDYEAAVDWALKALGQPNFQWSRYAVLIAALGQLGRTQEARHYIGEVISKRPDFSVSFVHTSHLFGDPQKMDHFLDGLAKTGLGAEPPGHPGKSTP